MAKSKKRMVGALASGGVGLASLGGLLGVEKYVSDPHLSFILSLGVGGLATVNAVICLALICMILLEKESFSEEQLLSEGQPLIGKKSVCC